VATADDRPAVLVTGAAGAIGYATVQAVTAAGFAVVGLDRAPAPPGSTHHHVEVDVTDAAALADVCDEAAGRARLAHVLSIAGGARPGEPDTQHDPTLVDPALFRESLEVNLTSQFLVLRAVLPWLRRGAGDRSVAFTSSFNALSGQGMPGYSAAKAGLLGMMHALVGPLGSEGIRVNVVAPGTIRTPRTERLWHGTPGHFERLTEGTAMGRLGEPDDVADAFVALTRLRHVTGQVLVVDGGQTVIHR
jgi:NAD(P)-dependent dehydrogenase (short-subunit alcohol dehydrogenase family)